MLVTTLFDVEGEEAAARAARQMAARSTPDGEPMLSANRLLLTQDWTGAIERAEADIDRAGGEGTPWGVRRSASPIPKAAVMTTPAHSAISPARLPTLP